MKYIALTLLLVNAAAFVWAGFFREPEAPVPAATRTWDDGTDTLELVSEVDASRQQALNRVINNPIRASVEEATVPRLCTALGPFATVFDAEAALQQAAALDIAAVMRAVDEVTGETDFRVLIPPASSIEEAFRKLRELKSLGIDSYIITQGGQALGISLGVFSTREAAVSLQAERARQGYEAVVDELPQVERQFWVFDQQGEALGARLDAWESLASPDPELTVTGLACPITESTS